MKLKSSRTIEELRDVLKNPKAEGPQTAYWVFNEVGKDKWENMTVLSPGTYDGEFVKTYGHYHSQEVNETYKLLHGKGVFILQKRKFGNDDWVSDYLSEIYFVELVPNETIIITPEWGHSWVNLGEEPLVTLDNWRSGHIDSDYQPMKELKGMGYYITKKGKSDDIDLIKNPNYREVPEPRFINAAEFNKLNALD